MIQQKLTCADSRQVLFSHIIPIGRLASNVIRVNTVKIIPYGCSVPSSPFPITPYNAPASVLKELGAKKGLKESTLPPSSRQHPVCLLFLERNSKAPQDDGGPALLGTRGSCKD